MQQLSKMSDFQRESGDYLYGCQSSCLYLLLLTLFAKIWHSYLQIKVLHSYFCVNAKLQVGVRCILDPEADRLERWCHDRKEGQKQLNASHLMQNLQEGMNYLESALSGLQSSFCFSLTQQLLKSQDL